MRKRQDIRTTERDNGTLKLIVNGNVVATMEIGTRADLADAFAAEFLANGYRGMLTMAAAKKAVAQ